MPKNSKSQSSTQRHPHKPTSPPQSPQPSVGTADPVNDFKTLMARSHAGMLVAAMNQMSSRIGSFLRESIGTQYFQKTLSCIIAFREESVDKKEYRRYNELLRDLKRLCWKRRLTGFKGFGGQLKKESHPVGLIVSGEVFESDVGIAGAAEFLSDIVEASQIASVAPAEEEEDEDLYQRANTAYTGTYKIDVRLACWNVLISSTSIGVSGAGQELAARPF
ncbi:UNVERIFIED_CONTAM: X-ray repair cross-complementing protein 5 [Siphonaria sp. JEL0065]|nr:X-ray repair cross-complementing protein 5 [Siphonaria sp. JEL0065]